MLPDQVNGSSQTNPCHALWKWEGLIKSSRTFLSYGHTQSERYTLLVLVPYEEILLPAGERSRDTFLTEEDASDRKPAKVTKECIAGGKKNFKRLAIICKPWFVHWGGEETFKSKLFWRLWCFPGLYPVLWGTSPTPGLSMRKSCLLQHSAYCGSAPWNCWQHKLTFRPLQASLSVQVSVRHTPSP